MNWMIEYAMRFIGVPYRWGGENPITGFDCSGLVQEVLRGIGMDPPGDQTAQALYHAFEKHSVESISEGCLLFFGKSNQHITHVAIALNSTLMIEAGGGGHLTLTEKDAAAQNAFVRIRPISHRRDLVAFVLPVYPVNSLEESLTMDGKGFRYV